MIKLRSKHVQAAIVPRGASLSGLWLAGRARSLVLGSPDPSAYRNHLTYMGAVVGPVANRISLGQVRIAAQIYQMPQNEGTACLHSGPRGLHACDWDVTDLSESSVRLSCALSDGDNGLPGERAVEIRYRLDPQEAALHFTLRATSNRDTVMNLAHHPYWTLDTNADISAHRLHVMAERYLPVSHHNLPNGDVRRVDGSEYDFRTPRVVPTDRALDTNYCLNIARCTTAEHAATLTGEDGVTLDILTTEPGLQVYNGIGLSAEPVAMHAGQILGPCAGIALEPQGWPDAPNQPGFPSITLAAGDAYEQKTTYRFS
ncbi:MAG: aldose epimerase family protein [Pseudomonadota bacterium]